jgi:hypothetical protein
MKKRSAQAFTIFLFFGLILFVLYLWGKVQIDFSVRKNADLRQACKILQHDIDDLHAEIDHLKSYPRITELAAEQGLMFPPPERIEDLSVDLDGLKPNPREDGREMVLASLTTFSRLAFKRAPAPIAGEADGTR